MARPFQPTKIAGQQLVPTEQEAEFKLKTSSDLFGQGYGQLDYEKEIIETRKALSQLTDNFGFPLYTPEEVEQEINSIIEQGFLGVYGTVEDTRVDNTSPDPRVPRPPDQTLMQKAGEAFAQGSYKYGEFTVAAQQAKPYLLKQGLSESDADKWIVGFQAVYDSLRDQGLSHEEALKGFDDGMNEEEKTLQLLDPDKLHKPRAIVGGTDRTVFDKQIQELDKTPDLNNVQMVFQSAIKNLEVQNLADDYISNGDMDDPVEHIKIKVPGGPERGFYVPTQYLEYIEMNKDYTTKDFSDYVYETDIRNGDYEIVKEVKYSDMGSIESNVEQLIETRDVFKPILAKIIAEETLSHQPKDSWYLSEESKKIVMANPTKFINEGILFDTSPGGGTIETDFHRALRTVFGVWGATVEASAPILTPVMLGATEYMAKPISDVIQQPFSEEISKEAPLSLDYIMGAEERRQDYLEGHYPQFAGSNIAERALAGFARGSIGLTLYTDAIRDEDYDVLTKVIGGVPVFAVDLLNPVDLATFNALAKTGKTALGMSEARYFNKVDELFDQGGVANITKTAVKEVLKAGADPLVKSGTDLAESLMIPKKYTEPLKDITRPADIRMSAGQKIRKEMEAREYVDLVQAENPFIEASKIADELDNVYPNSALAKMLRNRSNVQGVLDDHARVLFDNDAIPSLRKLDQQLDIVKRIEPGTTVERTVYNFKKSDEYKALSKTQKLEFNDAVLDVVKFVRRQRGHNTKLTPDDILLLKKHLQHRSSLMATIDLFPDGFRSFQFRGPGLSFSAGVGKNIQRLTESVFVDGKMLSKIEDAYAGSNLAKIFTVLASDAQNYDVVTRRAKQLEAEYARGAYDLSQVRNKNKMIYYNVTREQDMTAITLDKLDNDSINILKQEIDRLPIKRERKQQIFSDIDSGYITLKDQRYVTDVQLEDIAKQLQLDLPADMFARLPVDEQKTLSKAIGDPARGSVFEESVLGQAVNRYFDSSANATLTRLRKESAKKIDGRIAKQTSKDSRTPNFFLKNDDLEALPQMQQRVFQELINLVQSSKNDIKIKLEDVSTNFKDYGLTAPPEKRLDELSAYIRGKNANNNAGRLGQRSDLASMYNEMLIRFIGEVQTKKNVQMLDKFFDTKIFFTEPNYTTFGRDQLRLLSEEMADQFISNPTGLMEIFNNGARRWIDTLYQEAKIGRETILDNPLLKQDQSYLRGISGEEFIYQFFEPRLIEEAVPSLVGKSAKKLEKIQDEAKMNQYLHAYYIQELFKAQQKLVDDFIMPQLDDVSLKTLTPNVEIGRIEYFEAVKKLTRLILNKEYNKNGDFETARQLLNGAMIDSKMAKNKKLREMISDYPQRVRDTLIDGDVQEFNRATKQVLDNQTIQIERIKANYTRRIEEVKTQATERRQSVANQRTPEARSLRLRTNAKEKEFKRKLARAKKAELERVDRDTGKQIESLEAELTSNTERYTNVAETNEELLFELYKERVRTGVIESNPQYDEIIKIREDIPFIKPGEFNEDVFNFVDYVENVARQNNLWNRPKVTVDQLAGTLDDLFGTSNRLGQAYFGEKQYNEFFKLYEQYGLHALNDTFNMFVKQSNKTVAKDLWQGYYGYVKPFIYNALLATRPRFLGTNIVTAPSITYATTGKISSPGEVFQGFAGVFAGSNNQCAKYYKVAVTDPFGRSYTYGEIYEGIVAGGVATDLSYARSLSLNDRQFIRRMNQKTNRNMGIKDKMFRNFFEFTDAVFEFPIQSDMAFRIANAITSIKRGETFADAMKSAKVSMLDYTNITKKEQELQHFFIFYNFTRQMTFNAIHSLFNAEAAARAAKVVRFNQDLEATERLINDGAVYPYNVTLPDYQQMRAGFLLHKRNMANKDVWMFSPPVPLIESYAIIYNLFGLLGRDQQSQEFIINRGLMLINPMYKDVIFENQRVPTRVPPHIVGTLSAIAPDQQTLEQMLSFVSCEQVQGELDPNSIYAVNNMVYPLTDNGMKSMFMCNQNMIRSLMKSADFFLKIGVLDVAFRDYYNIISGVGTPYEDLSLTMKLTSGIGLTTPSNVTKPVVGEIEQHQRRMELLREPQRELKRQQESRGLE